MGVYSAAILGTSGLLSYWRLNETSGTTAADSGPTALDLTYTNSPSLNQGSALINNDGNSVKCSATSPQSYTAKTSGAGALGGLTALTFEGWVKWASGTTFNYVFRMNDALLRARLDGGIECNLPLGGVNISPGIKGTGTANGAWHYLAVTWNGSSLSLYLNGSAVTSGYSASGTLQTITNAYIGAYQPGAEYTNGYQSEVAVYNRALTADEILYHYNLGKGIIANDQRSRPGRTLQAVKRSAIF